MSSDRGADGLPSGKVNHRLSSRPADGLPSGKVKHRMSTQPSQAPSTTPSSVRPVSKALTLPSSSLSSSPVAYASISSSSSSSSSSSNARDRDDFGLPKPRLPIASTPAVSTRTFSPTSSPPVSTPVPPPAPVIVESVNDSKVDLKQQNKEKEIDGGGDDVMFPSKRASSGGSNRGGIVRSTSNDAPLITFNGKSGPLPELIQKSYQEEEEEEEELNRESESDLKGVITDAQLEAAMAARHAEKVKEVAAMQGELEMQGRSKSQMVRPMSVRETKAQQRKVEQDRIKKEKERIDSELQRMVPLDAKGDNNMIIRVLVEGNVYGFPGTGGEPFSNYFAFVKNWHPLLAIFTSHSLNPYKPRDRVIVFLCVNAFSFALIVFLLDWFYLDSYLICKDGCRNKQLKSGSSTEYICGSGSGDNVGRSTDEYDEECTYYSPFLLSMIAATVAVPYEVFLRTIATCSCFQGREEFDNWKCLSCIKFCAEYTGKKTLLVFGVLSLMMILYGVLKSFSMGLGQTILTSHLITTAVSQVEFFPIAFIYFLVVYNCHKRWFVNLYKAANIERVSETPEIRMARALSRVKSPV